MEDSNLEENLEKVVSKTSDMPDERFAKFEHSLRNDIVNLRDDLNNAKEINKTKSKSLSMILNMTKN